MGGAGTQSYATGSIGEGADGQQKPLNWHEASVPPVYPDNSRDFQSEDVFVCSRVDTVKNGFLISIQARLTLKLEPLWDCATS